MRARRALFKWERVVVVGLLALMTATTGSTFGQTAGDEGAYLLTIWNRSEFELLELYVHSSLGYAEATDLLGAPLPDEATTDVPFDSGHYVTVVRRRVEGGERIAFTTRRPLEVSGDGYTLIVFQESFRLLYPEDVVAERAGCACGGALWVTEDLQARSAPRDW